MNIRHIAIIVACVVIGFIGCVALAAEPEPQLVYVLDHNTGDLYSGTPDTQGIVHIDTTGYVD